jgi:hypothetical protein
VEKNGSLEAPTTKSIVNLPPEDPSCAATVLAPEELDPEELDGEELGDEVPPPPLHAAKDSAATSRPAAHNVLPPVLPRTGAHSTKPITRNSLSKTQHDTDFRCHGDQRLLAAVRHPNKCSAEI